MRTIVDDDSRGDYFDHAAAGVAGFLDGQDLFFIGGQTIQQRIKNAGLLACRDQIAEQLVEIKGVFAECLC